LTEAVVAHDSSAGFTLAVRLTPKAARDALDGLGADEAGRPLLKARVRAAPEDGKANAALCTLLAKALDIAPSRISVARGHASRLKQVLIEGGNAADIAAKLAHLAKD
jgi:hypothetical protein